MFTLFISAQAHNVPAFSRQGVRRCHDLMLALETLGQAPELVIGSCKDNKELTAMVRNCTLSVHQIKHLMRNFSQESALIAWEKPGVAELIGTGEYSKTLALEFQKTNVLPENATFIISDNVVMLAK